MVFPWAYRCAPWGIRENTGRALLKLQADFLCDPDMPSARTPDASATLSDWLQYLESIHATAIDMGLDRVREVADRMDLELSGVKLSLIHI